MKSTLARAVCLAAALAVVPIWLRAAATIDAVSASQTHVSVGLATVLFTATITEPSVIGAGVNLLKTDAAGRTLSLVGVMNDAGVSGDRVAGDKVFSREVVINETSIGSVYYRVSAPFKGVILRTLSPIIPITIDPPVGPPANAAPTVSAGADQSITLPATATLLGSVSDDGLPAGATVVVSWSQVSGPGAVTFGTPGSATTSASFSTAGTYVLRLTGDDTEKSSADEVTVTVNPAVIVPPPVNGVPTANAGGPYTGEANVAVVVDGTGSSDPDGDTLVYSWDFGDGSPSGSGPKPSHVYGQAGDYTLALTVVDGRGGSQTASTPVIVAAPVDRAPPLVRLSGPAQALPGAQVMMVADANDNVGVTSVILDVNGGDPVEISVPPFQRLVTVPDAVAPGTTLKIGAVARDAAGNTGSAAAGVTVVAEPDTTKPTVVVKAPPQAAPGAVLSIAATAADNVSVASVVLSSNGAAFASLSHPPYESAFTVPLDAPVGASLIIAAQAVDSSGNQATNSATVLVVQTADTTPPSIDLSAPPTAQAGTAVPILATASDNVGVASVRFFVDGAPSAVVLDPPYSTSLLVPLALPAGARLHVEARATDFSGLQSVAAKNIDIVETGEGVLTGKVIDDGTGLLLGGATVALVGKDARGIPYTQTTVSDAVGRYVIHATEGSGTVSISKDGWSSLHRLAVIRSQVAVELVDARLTGTTAGVAVVALTGGLVRGDSLAFLQTWRREVSVLEDPSLIDPAQTGGPDVSLRVPPGALPVNTTLAVTPISRQGLAGLLPPGWTPVAALDIAPHGTVLADGVTVSAPNPFNLKAGAAIVFARWDEQVRAWRAVGTSTLPQDKAVLDGAVPMTGQFAWLLADAAPLVPPNPAPGDLIAGVQPALIPPDVTALVDPQPRILFYKPGVKSDVRGTVTTTGPLLSSGTIVKSRIIEFYQFVSQSELHLEPVEQDLVLYQIPGGVSPVMAAGFPVSPSLVFEPLSLAKGIITVELRAPEETVHEIALIGGAGGAVDAPTGERIEVPAGSVSSPLPLEIHRLLAAELGATVPSGFTVVGAASLSFASVLAAPATLSIPKPPTAGGLDTFLFARLQELRGETRFVLVGVASVVNDRLVSQTTLDGSAAVFEGITTPGRYVFLRATNPLAFVAGSVTGADGGAFGGALLTSNNLSIVSLSQTTSSAAGRYISAVPLGDSTLTALDLLKTDTVGAPVTTTAPRQVVALDLALAARPPTVTSVTPVNGAVNIALADPIIIRFSSPIDPATATLQSIQLSSNAGLVIGTLALTSNNTVATFRAIDALLPNLVYTLTVSQSVKDPFGRSLPSAFVSAFTSLDTIAPLPPPAGSITATIPGADGKTTINATQGTAGTHDTVKIKNVTKGTFTPVILDPNGGFIVIVPAALTDKLQLLITDPSGNETLVALARFRQSNPDGTVSEAVGAEGGRLEGPGGVVIDVPAGAFSTGAVVRFGPVTEAEFPFHLTTEQRLLFQYSGGIRIDLGGVVPTTYLNVSVPTLGGETSLDQWLVTQAQTIAGQSSVAIVDTARVIAGRITTSSPPCPGVTGSGVYGFLKAARPLGVVYGPVTVDRTLPPGVFIPFLVGPGLIGFPLSPSDLLTPQIDGTLSIQDPLGLGNFISAAGETAAVFSRMPACLPLLSGKATLTQNRVAVVVPTAQLTPADREIEVVNVPRGKTTRFFTPFPPALSVEGGNTDALLVTAVAVDGSRRTLPVTLKPRSYVHVLVAASEFQDLDRQITIRNVSGTGVFTSGLSGSPTDIEALIEGTPSDTYVVEITGATGPRPAAFGVSPYSYGGGNLLLRAVPGTIDPTLAQIVAFNATVPLDQRLKESGAVTSVVLQIDTQVNTPTGPATVSRALVIADPGDTSHLVGGSFYFPFEGSLDDTYTLHVLYADGKTVDLKIPMLRINMTNPTTGAVVRRVSAAVPPRDEPLLLDLAPPTGPTEVTTAPRSLQDVDPRLPLTLTFSRALDTTTANTNLVVFTTDSAGALVQVPGTWRFSQGNRVARFVPAGALLLNKTYRVALSGVTDLAGQPLGGSSVVVTTFRPRPIGTAVLHEPPVGGIVPLQDVSFLRQPGPGGKLATRVIAASSNRDGFKVHTIDVTDPHTPTETGHTAGGSYKRRLTLLPGVTAPTTIDIRYDVQLVPQQTGMSCWAAGTAMIAGWRDRTSIDPKAVADRVQYNYEKGLFGTDREVFNAWGLVAEPLQSYSVEGYRQMLERYGPLWVSSAVPSTHIRVITGIDGDGTPGGTYLYINDPWQAGMTNFALPNEGNQYAITYQDFEQQLETLAREWFGEPAVMQELCDSGTQIACQALADPAILQALKECSAGNEAICADLHLPGGAGAQVAHLPQLPAWVPPVETGALTIRPPKPNEGPIAVCKDHVILSPSGKQHFNGDLAVTSSWNQDTNYVTFFDVTDPANPCVIGDKTLTANPETLNSFTRPGTVHVQGFARGVTTLHHAQGYAAYMAIAQAGVFAVDIGKSLPSVSSPSDREEEGFYAGDFADVIAVRDRLLALNNNFGGDATLDVLDPNLSLITTVVLTGGGATKQHRIVYAPASWVDANRNGQNDDGETFDLAYVAGSGGLIVIDVTNLDAPTVVGQIKTPGIMREITVDGSGRTLFVGGGRGNVTSPGGGLVPLAGDVFYMIDASNPFATPVTDATGRDSRIVFEYLYPDGVGGMAVDSQRGLLYVGSPAINTPKGALDIWAINRTARIAFNRAPIANAGPDADVEQNALVTLDGRGSTDPDGDPLTFEWKQTSGPVVWPSGATGERPTFQSPAIDGAVLTFQLIVDDGVLKSAVDTVTITVKAQDRLKLQPVIAPIVVVPGSKQLSVTLQPANGDPDKDVTADAKTTYRWIGSGLVSGTDGLPDINPILSALAAKLGIPLQLAVIDVSPSGLVSVTTPGIQVVRAHYKDGTTEIDSNPSVVLAGIKLKEITLRPESPLTTLVGAMTEALGSDKNPPMILAADENGYISDKGVILLDDVVFEMLGSATISLKDLLDAINPLIEDALTAALAPETGPAAPVLAKGFTKLLGLGINYAGTQFLTGVESLDAAVATVTDRAPLQGFVQSHGPGLTSITGTLDLGPLGKADDSVLVWVLPDITSATIEPNVTVIQRTLPPTPGPSVRTFATVNIGQAIIELKGKVNAGAQLLDRFLPDGLASWNVGIDKDFVVNVPAPNLRFHFRGSMTPNCGAPDAAGEVHCFVTFANVGLGFYSPNVFNHYTTLDTAIADLGVSEMFDTHIVHQGVVGETPLHVNVSVPFMGHAEDLTAKVLVLDDGPVLLKTVQTDAYTQAGSLVEFKVTVTNPFDHPLTNVQVTDTLYFTNRGSTSEVVLQTTALPLIASMQPHEVVTIPASLTTVIAPSVAGTLRNVVTAAGAPPSSVSVVVALDTLTLTPEFIALPNAPGTQQLTVTLHHDGGTSEDVTRSAFTNYEWIGSTLPRTVVDEIYAKINAALAAEGQPPVPAQLAVVSVDPATGMLSVTSNGLQLLRATHNGLESNTAFVLAGIQLKKIDLTPFSKLNTVQSAIVDLDNPPMLLVANVTGNDGIFDKVGQVVLTDARFEILGGPATISVKKLVDALTSAVGNAVTAFTLETGPLAKVFGWASKLLLTGILDEAGTQLLEPVTSTNPAVATVVDQAAASIPSLRPVGRVDALLSGLTDIKGTLNLGSFGKASDNVLTWVLPVLDTVQVEPQITYIDLNQLPPPDPKVRTFATVTAGNTGVPMPLTGKFNDVAQAVDDFLPGGWTGSGVGTFTLTTGRLTANIPVEQFGFSLEGTASVGCAQPGADESGCFVTVTNLKFGFHVPNLVAVPPLPSTRVTYTVGPLPTPADPLVATTTLDTNSFDTHVVKTGAAGLSSLKSDVDMTDFGMGSKDDPNAFIVTRELSKRLVSFVPPIATFELIVTNAQAFDLVDVVVRDDLFSTVPGSCVAGALISSQTVTVISLAAHESRRLTVSFPVPPGAASVVDIPVLVSAKTSSGSSVSSLSATTTTTTGASLCTRRPVINEVVVTPQRDWNDSGGGGNGVAFDAIPGTGVAPSPAVTSADQWVELLTNTGTPAELLNWTLEFTNAVGVPVTVTLGPSTLKTTAGSPYVLIGAPGGIAVGSIVKLVDPTLAVVDEIDLGAIHSAVGSATGVGDESLARTPDGFDSNSTSDFVRKPASIGVVNP
ncbi:MAG: papain-like cysteine protease family protein [Vicinamibacterales bacterium]